MMHSTESPVMTW